MDPPVAALAAALTAAVSSLDEPQGVAAETSSGGLLPFDALGSDGEAFPPSAALNGLSIPAHEALMSFLADMEALDRDNADQQRSSGGRSSDTDTMTISATEQGAQVPGDEVLAIQKKGKGEKKTKAKAAAARQDFRKATRVVKLSATTNAAKPGKKRIRAKQEIDMLREDAVALQRRLETMRSTATLKRQLEAETPKPSKKPKLRHVSAVEQNQQLRNLVKTQLRYSKQIENVLMRQASDDEAHRILISDNDVKQTPLSKADLGVFYGALAGNLDELYAQLDDVFADCQLSNKPQFHDVKLVIGDDKYATLQLRDMNIVPFSFESVKRVTWQYLKAQCVKEDDGADKFVVVSDDVMLMRRGLTVQLEKGEPEVDIPMRAVCKRFLSKDRMVFCWDGSTDWPIPPSSEKPGPQSISLRERGWTVIKPVPGAPGLSTMQMCMLMTPSSADGWLLAVASREEIKDKITKFVIPMYQQLFVSRYQMVENMLLDERKR